MTLPEIDHVSILVEHAQRFFAGEAGTGIKMPHMRRNMSQTQYLLEKVCCVINK